MPKEIDKIKVGEVILFAENNVNAYDALMRNYLPNLSKKVLKGTYDSKLAVKLLVYYYENYVRVPFSNPREMGFDPKLNKEEKNMFAEHFVEYLETEFLNDIKKKIAILEKQKVYTLQLSHDRGKSRINIQADSETEAIKRVCKLEGCPEGAVKVLSNKPVKVTHLML